MLRALAARFRKADEGALAVEFALVAPIMVLLLLASVELPRAIAVNQKVARAARTVADLASRDGITSMDDLYAAGAAVADMNLADLDIVVTAAGVYAESGSLVSKVCSSRAYGKTQLEAETTIGPAPPASAEAKARYLIAEVGHSYAAAFNLFPALNGRRFSYRIEWPVRKGTTYNGAAEVVLPGGKPCKA